MSIVVILVIIIGILAVLLVLLGIAFLKKNTTGSNKIESHLQNIEKIMNTRFHENTESMIKQINEQSETSRKIITEITKELTEVKANSKEMLSFTEQLQSLERILKNPQQRGVLGEYVLEQVIANVLPPDSYATQYTFSKSKVRADAVVFLQDKKIIAIDAKFSLDNYARLLTGKEENPKKVEQKLREDLKNRIKETAKYILPKENTLDYAFMFIPSESLYYDLLTQKIGTGDTAQNMLEYAFSEQRVIIVSPVTLLAYLQTVNLGLRSFKIEKHAQEITKQVLALKKHLEAYTKSFHAVGRALGTAVNQYNKAEQQYQSIDKDVFKITGDGGTYQRTTLDAPHGEDEKE